MKYKILKFTYTILHYFSFILSVILSIYLLEYFEVNSNGLVSWVLLICSWLVFFLILNVMCLKKLIFKGFIKENTPRFWYDDNKGHFGWHDEIQVWDWVDVGKVEIITTDEGPWSEDLYWIISFNNRNHCIVIPQGAEGGNAMMDVIPDVLGEPDWMKAAEAMGSCINNKFLIWVRNESTYAYKENQSGQSI